jgi:hypothetical protein
VFLFSFAVGSGGGAGPAHSVSPYCVPFAFHLSTDVDPAFLRQCLHAIAMRHQVLRTRFEFDETTAELYQVVCDDVPDHDSLLSVFSGSTGATSSASTLSASPSSSSVNALFDLASHFDLDRGIVFRAALLPCVSAATSTCSEISPVTDSSSSSSNQSGQVFLLVFHHIAFDGWSLQLFANELSALFRRRYLGQQKCKNDESSHIFVEASNLLLSSITIQV